MNKHNSGEQVEDLGYPALNLCVVIDARLGSRRLIVRDIRASALFENIVEASYVDQGLTLLAEQSVDACFIGPSVSRERLVEFVSRVGKLSAASDCALIAIFEPCESAGSGTREMVPSAVHGMIVKPYSKKSLSEATIQAVLAANADGVWGKIARARLKDEAGVKAREIINRASSRLGQIVLGYRDYRYGLDLYGEPTEETRAILKAVVCEMLGSDKEAGHNSEFGRFFLDSLNEWFLDMVQTNPKLAGEKLRRKIGGYRG